MLKNTYACWPSYSLMEDIYMIIANILHSNDHIIFDNLSLSQSLLINKVSKLNCAWCHHQSVITTLSDLFNNKYPDFLSSLPKDCCVQQIFFNFTVCFEFFFSSHFICFIFITIKNILKITHKNMRFNCELTHDYHIDPEFIWQVNLFQRYLTE